MRWRTRSSAPAEGRSAAREALVLSGALALLYLLHAWVLLDVMALAPGTAAAAAVVLVVAGALALDLVDVHLIGTLAAAPFLTVARFPGPFAIMVAALVLPIAVLELHPIVGPWPGALASCAGLGVLLALLRGPRQLFGQIVELATEPADSDRWSRRRIYRYLRGVGPTSRDAGRAELDGVERRWERDDSHGRGGLFFNAAGWFVAWACLFAVLQLSTVFRSIDMVVPGAFLDSPPGSWPQWSWLVYTVETFLLRGELAFEIYEVFELDAATLLGYEPIRAGRGLNLAIVAVHLGIVLMLADAVFSHFSLVGHLHRLVDRAAVDRYEGRFDDPAYGALRVLRPLAEPLVLRRLRHEGRPSLRLLAATLLRSARGRRFQRGLLLDRTQPFQVRLAALHSLLGVAGEQGHGHFLVAEARSMLAELDVDPSADQFDSLVQGLCWLEPPPRSGSATAARAWFWDVTSIANSLSAATGDGSAMVPASGSRRPVYAVVAAARSGTRRAFLELLTELPNQPKALASVFTDLLPQKDYTLGPADHELLHRIHHLRTGTWTEQLAAIQWLSPEHLGSVPREVISDLLLRRIGRFAGSRVPYPYLAALARLGVGERAVTAVVERWQRETATERWAVLLAGMVAIGRGEQRVSSALLDALEERDAHAREGGQPVDLTRWVLWRALCEQASAEFFEAEFGRRVRETSLGSRLWEVPAGEVQVGGRRTGVESFWAAGTAVTFDQWQVFVEHRDRRDGQQTSTSACKAPGSSRSVVRVSWTEACAFCRWLTVRERAAGRLPEGWEVRLPTELEWQHAAQGGRPGHFWFGECFDPRLVRSRVAPPATDLPPLFTCEGGAFRNAWGLADMLGNVWEWCLNQYDAPDLHTAPAAESPGSRALRGGAWCSDVEACSALVRSGWEPGAALDHVGFRFVLAPIASMGASAPPRSLTP